jgi:mRNA deadenylase 3'-5' endonuclease subunit Ccr4
MPEEIKLPNRDIFCYILGSPHYLNSQHPRIMAQNWMLLGQRLELLGKKYDSMDFYEVKQNPEYARLAREFLDRAKTVFMKDVEKAPVKQFTLEETVRMLKGSRNGKTLVECLFAYEGNTKEATELFEEIQEEKKKSHHSKRPFGGDKRRGKTGYTIH